MKKGNERSGAVIGIISILALSGPLIIAKLTCFPTKLTNFSDESASWFSFYASYSGTLATLLVALFTWKSSRKMEELQRRYYELDTDVNLRLSKVAIVPQIMEKGKLDQYKITLVFDNMAKNLIHEIGFKRDQISVTIGTTTERVDIIKPEYFMRDGKPILQFYSKIDESPMKEMFAGFYFYFSQFSLDTPRMKLELKLDIKYGEKDKDRTTRDLRVELLPTPMIEQRRKYLEFSEEEYAAESYEILIESYKLERHDIGRW